MSKKYYTVPEAAAFTRLAVPTFRKFRPEVGGRKVGRVWIFSEEELVTFMESKRRKPLRELQAT